MVIWDASKKIDWGNIELIVETKSEAKGLADISGDTEAQHNTPYKSFVPILITPLPLKQERKRNLK